VICFRMIPVFFKRERRRVVVVRDNVLVVVTRFLCAVQTHLKCYATVLTSNGVFALNWKKEKGKPRANNWLPRQNEAQNA
jgi:hypothetical protein